MTTTLPDQLWLATDATRQAILQAAFVKGIKDKNLDPVKFCQFTIQDAIYVYKSKLSIDAALRRSSPGPVTDLLRTLSQNYATYATAMLDGWLIKENVADSAVKLGQACSEYIAYEKTVAETMNPIYFLVALLPCLRTWYWIGQQLATADKGIYTAWANDNFAGSTWRKLEAQVEAAYLVNAIDKAEAQTVYDKCMEYELRFFDSVRNQTY
ncbi:uncharacterized protein LOC110451234 [Mizuhopecten yessoensis]|uniref:Thiaminase-2/PQQC domain-containing protein n=1 Tax=Mizuhopecten yessoensis TaxID=6573 RepID=A0A210QM58_MIZYE|nr:uncharacterized protein LOC110451234 [Mizuhopecten yessoensis]OWF49819.1 hypothetical protein KP79_PYT05733 [Mizuhopecten yessoensis]